MSGIRNEAIKIAHDKGYAVSECGTAVTYRNKERKLQEQKLSGKTYYRFSVGVEGRSVNIYVHRLQAYSKYGSKIFREGIVVRHKNDNSTDNSKKNIVIGTQSQNMKDKYRNKKRR